MPDFDDDRPESPPAEGVRILGAEEAQAAVEGVPERPRAEEPKRRRRPRAARGRAARGPVPVAGRPAPRGGARPRGAARPAAAGGPHGR